jgi:hypothetical protein
MRFYDVVETIGVPGDYNFDGTVNAADYVVWRNGIGTQDAYDVWRANFGHTSATSATSAIAPEQSTLLLLASSGLLLLSRVVRRASLSY